ncbi:MAG TPA: protein kinase [Acidimicrobiia bacterium]
MPPPLPDRYRLEVRIGRDGDTEQWLATDLALDRPVLIRVVGPETTQERRSDFLRAVQGAANVSHVHLAAIYEAAEVPDGAFSVSEWGAGMTLGDRLAANEPLPVDDFLTNGAGLADALASLHREGILHGAIDPSAVLFSSAHPAKLSAFGRMHRGLTAATDVHDLALALETALIGGPALSMSPSQIVDRLPQGVDTALEDARVGRLDAAGLAEALRAIPSITPAAPETPGVLSWGIPAAILFLLAAVLILLGSTLDAGPLSPVLFPARPIQTTTLTLPQTTTTKTLPAQAATDVGVTIRSVAAYDPFGDEVEQHSREQPPEALADGDTTTTWRTERYVDPLSLQKPGVGVTLQVRGTPRHFLAQDVTPGIHYTLYWSQTLPDDFAEWEKIAAGAAEGGLLTVQLPVRTDGVWLWWFTELPQQADGFYGGASELRFTEHAEP